jgi:hypothetical protein
MKQKFGRAVMTISNAVNTNINAHFFCSSIWALQHNAISIINAKLNAEKTAKTTSCFLL